MKATEAQLKIYGMGMKIDFVEPKNDVIYESISDIRS